MLQNVAVGDIDADWPGTVAEYIRHNDEAVLRTTDKLLNAYQNDFLNCGSFDEFCDRETINERSFRAIDQDEDGFITKEDMILAFRMGSRRSQASFLFRKTIFSINS